MNVVVVFLILFVVLVILAVVAVIINGIRQSRLNPTHLKIEYDSPLQNESQREVISSTAPKVISQNDFVTVTMSTKFSVRDVPIYQKTKGQLQPVSIDAFSGYVSPSGGYVNYGRFQVVGINPATKRKNKRIYEELNESYALQRAKINGLVEPFDISTLPSIPPSEAQLNYAQDLGISIPDGACKVDVSALISRVTDDDEAPMSETIAEQAHIYGVKFSRYHGKKAVLEMARSLPKEDYRDFMDAIK